MGKLIIIIIASLVSTNTFAQKIKSEVVRSDNGTLLYGLQKDGKWIVEPIYKYAKWNSRMNIGEVENGKGYSALVNEKGKIITPFKYTSIVEFCSDCPRFETWLRVRNGDLEGVVDINGKEILPCIYYGILDEFNKYIKLINSSYLYGYSDFDGNIILEAKYANLFHFSSLQNYYPINIGGKSSKSIYGLYDNPVGGKWGICNKKGENVVPCVYDDVSVVIDSLGLFAVNRGGGRDEKGNSNGGKWGLYANGQEIIKCQYDNIPEFKNDVATVKIDGEVKLIKNPLKDGSQIQIADNTTLSSNKKAGRPVVSRYPKPDSDVDKNIPTAKKQEDNTFAFIICNENYPDAPVPYSLNDGRMFREYCQKTLGIPEKNINLHEDATFGTIITAVEKMKSIADAYDGDASIIFYYAGHGFPDEKQNTAYLLPIDGDASDITTTGYSLAKLYKELSKLKLKSVIVLLDACFSGAKREDQMLSETRGVAIKVKEEAPQGNLLVFSAAQGDETAHQMEEKHHGLFTYFLLKELQATGGDVDMGTLTEYVTKQVKRQSVVINNKKQTPTVIPSQALLNNWQSMKLK